jgi:rubrerythrin
MKEPVQLNKALANVCLKCPVCRRARKRQYGAAYWLVQKVESHVCPFCRAYERVFGQKAYERRAPTPKPPSRGTNRSTARGAD